MKLKEALKDIATTKNAALVNSYYSKGISGNPELRKKVVEAILASLDSNELDVIVLVANILIQDPGFIRDILCHTRSGERFIELFGVMEIISSKNGFLLPALQKVVSFIPNTPEYKKLKEIVGENPVTKTVMTNSYVTSRRRDKEPAPKKPSINQETKQTPKVKKQETKHQRDESSETSSTEYKKKTYNNRKKESTTDEDKSSSDFSSYTGFNTSEDSSSVVVKPRTITGNQNTKPTKTITAAKSSKAAPRVLKQISDSSSSSSDPLGKSRSSSPTPDTTETSSSSFTSTSSSASSSSDIVIGGRGGPDAPRAKTNGDTKQAEKEGNYPGVNDFKALSYKDKVEKIWWYSANSPRVLLYIERGGSDEIQILLDGIDMINRDAYENGEPFSIQIQSIGFTNSEELMNFCFKNFDAIKTYSKHQGSFRILSNSRRANDTSGRGEKKDEEAGKNVVNYFRDILSMDGIEIMIYYRGNPVAAALHNPANNVWATTDDTAVYSFALFNAI